MISDQHNLQLTTTNVDAAKAYDKTIIAYLSLSQETGPLLKSIFENDENMVMAHCLKGYFFILMGNAKLLPRALNSYKEAKKHSNSATLREKAHIKALRTWCDHDDEGALSIWEEILNDFPNDILALRLAHHAHFYSGDSNAMCRSIEKVLPKWSEEMPGYSFILGMRAFAHEENRNFKFAEEEGRRAVSLNPNDPWSIHSVLHVLEMQDRHDEGISWLEGLEPHWTNSNNFRHHLWWHKALIHIDKREFDEVVKLYDEKIWDAESEEYLDFCNDISMLVRMEICGINVGKRWEDIGYKLRDRTEEHIRTFSDAHFALALSTVGNFGGVKNLIKTFSEKGGEVRMEIGVPLCQAMFNYRKENYFDCFKVLNKLKSQLFRIGGSNAQRDLFDQILIDSAIRCDHLKEAKVLLEERLRLAPKNILTKQKLDKLVALINGQ